MLSTRILTAAIAVPIIVLAIFLLPMPGLTVLVGILMLIGAWEWGRLIQLHDRTRIGFVGATALCMLLSLSIPGLDVLVLLIVSLFWLAAIVMIKRYPDIWPTTLGRKPWAVATGLLTLTAPVVAVTYIDQPGHGPWLILWLCLMIWGADTGAYISGKNWGRSKLVPHVSPGKTHEGVWGGLLTATLIGLLGALALGVTGLSTIYLAALGAWIAAVSIVGDLTISMFKRSSGVKDSGQLFPGHGGVLDRLDSMLAAAPWFVIGTSWLHLAA